MDKTGSGTGRRESVQDSGSADPSGRRETESTSFRLGFAVTLMAPALATPAPFPISGRRVELSLGSVSRHIRNMAKAVGHSRPDTWPIRERQQTGASAR